MKNTVKKYLFSFVLALWASALSAQSHWNFDYTQYQHRMTIWYMLQDSEVNVANLENYEVAAFVGDECRGIGTVITQGGNTVCQLLVYSNDADGEKLSFKAYDKTTMEEKELYGNMVQFSADGITGMPSTPYLLDFVQKYIPGDADGDMELTINDVIMTINAALGNPSASFNSAAADLDGDGEITINDVIKEINLVLQN